MRFFNDTHLGFHMKWIFGKTALWLLITTATAAAAFAFVQEASLPEGEGKKILETACTACHDLDVVTKSRMTKEDWEAEVRIMIASGAELKEDQIPLLVDYLAKNFGPAKP